MNRRFAATALLAVTATSAIAAPDGSQLYQQHCAACHQASGTGVPGTFPPLKGNPALQHDDFVAAVVLHGLQTRIHVDGTTYDGQMPAWKAKLDDAQVAAVLSFVRTQFNDFGPLDEKTVAQARAGSTDPTRLLPDSNKGPQPDPSGKDTSASSGALGNRTMDSAALQKAFADVRYDPPFIGDLERQTGEFAEMAKLGYLIFNDTQRYAAKYVGNGLNCRNCHLQAGAQADSAPLWGAFPNFPSYRGKNHLVNSFENRVQGCFLYSMNGEAPPASGMVLEAMSAYAAWLSQGLPLGVSPQGRGYPEVKDFSKPDRERGARLYQAKCAICHGDHGQGTPVTDGPGYQFPPLWGPDSYNWGAGMHKEAHFRNFIKANMPLGQGGTLSDQEAADIAAFVDQPSHPRPTRVHNPGQAPNF